METNIFSPPAETARKTDVLGEKQGFLARLFGCFHARLSRPVTIENVTFQYCAKCGARRQYDIETFKPFGAFYQPRIKTDDFQL